jgi:hypothetical protein
MAPGRGLHPAPARLFSGGPLDGDSQRTSTYPASCFASDPWTSADQSLNGIRDASADPQPSHQTAAPINATTCRLISPSDENDAGVQQCLAHLYRYLDDACATGSVSQVWTRQAGDALRAAAAAVRAARGARQASLEPALLAGLRRSYDQAAACGISVNLSRPWHKGNHPGLVLARRLKRKAAQVWLFATRFDVPATNNGSENAVRGYKLAAKISGCWRTLATLQRHCRIRSYLATARQPRPPPSRRHPRRRQRELLDATATSMIN